MPRKHLHDMFQGSGPEADIQRRIMSYLREREWFVRPTTGSLFQSGFPDLFCTHRKYGHRWVEVKNPSSYRFTPAQLEMFPLLCANGSGVWVLVDSTHDEYEKLFTRFNWLAYVHI
jgi:hypothetical protein